MVINQYIYRTKLEIFEMIYFINNIALKMIARLYGPLARIMKRIFFRLLPWPYRCQTCFLQILNAIASQTILKIGSNKRSSPTSTGLPFHLPQFFFHKNRSVKINFTECEFADFAEILSALFTLTIYAKA